MPGHIWQDDVPPQRDEQTELLCLQQAEVGNAVEQDQRMARPELLRV